MKQYLFGLVLGGMILASVQPVHAQEGGARGLQRIKDARATRSTLTPARYLKMIEKLQKDTIETLKPEEELTSDLREVFAKYIGEVRQQIDTERESRREMAEESRELMRELREARAEDDRERAKEVREELTKLRRHKGEADRIHQDLFDEVRDLLSEGEIEDFDDLAETFERQLDRKGGSSSGDKLAILRKIVATLQLDPDQREAVKGIVDDAKREVADAKGDQEKTDAIFKSARNDIREELNDEQAEVFNQRLEKAIKRSESRRIRSVRERPIERSAAPKLDDADSADADNVLEPESVELPADGTDEDELR